MKQVKKKKKQTKSELVLKSVKNKTKYIFVAHSITKLEETAGLSLNENLTTLISYNKNIKDKIQIVRKNNNG